MSALPAEMPTFYRGYFIRPERPNAWISVFQTLTQGARRRMGVVAEVAHVIHGPALAFLNHQHFVFPALGALFQLHAQGNIARVAIRDGGGAGDIGAVGWRCATGEKI